MFALLTAGAAAASPYAPLNRPGPKLRVAKEKLRESLFCTEGVRDAVRAPVLLVPATGVNSDQNFSWNYEKLLAQEDIPYCTSDQPGPRNSNQTDIQVRGQYLTFAIRKVHRMAGRRIAVMGHSQGGMAMRWPLRFWPGTRRMVDDVIGFAGTNQGTDEAAGCDETCTPAGAQQASDSDFIKALNSGAETFAGISYTEVGTERDETVTPQPGASYVDGPGDITNVLIQEVCPNATSEHLMVGTVDPAAAALALDAPRSPPRPGRPRRISPLVCAQPFQPGVDPVTAPAEIAAAIKSLYLNDGPTGGEPKLRCYVFKTNKKCRQRYPGDAGRTDGPKSAGHAIRGQLHRHRRLAAGESGASRPPTVALATAFSACLSTAFRAISLPGGSAASSRPVCMSAPAARSCSPAVARVAEHRDASRPALRLAGEAHEQARERRALVGCRSRRRRSWSACWGPPVTRDWCIARGSVGAAAP